MTKCAVVTPGQVEYGSAWEIQKRLHAKVAAGDIPNVLLLLEHPHVYTLGRRGQSADILVDEDRLEELGVQVHHIDRGGEVTYHGPGQLVGYPIIDLRASGLGPLKYVRSLEEVIVSTLAEFRIAATSDEKPTGVWVDDAKIAAIGVRVSKGTTMHGFALNVNPDMSYFDHIVPCGMPDATVTSMAEQGVDVDMADVVEILSDRFARVLDFSVVRTELDEIDEALPVAEPISTE
jgi:lipoate-protein ligase B